MSILAHNLTGLLLLGCRCRFPCKVARTFFGGARPRALVSRNLLHSFLVTAKYLTTKRLNSQASSPFAHQSRRAEIMETSTRSTASTAHSTAEAVKDPLGLRNIIAVETSHIIQDKLRLYIIAALLFLWLSAQLRRYIARNPDAGCWYGWDALALAAMAFFSQQNQYAIACVFTAA
jgi:hypothetical protein